MMTNDECKQIAKQRLSRMMMMMISSCRNNGLPYDPTTTVLFLLEQFHDDHDKLLEFLETTTCPLHILNGHPGILANISQFVGMETDPKILCSARGLVTFYKQKSSLSWNHVVPPREP